MRTTHWKAHLLPLLLLSFYSVSVCLADVCLFDEYTEKINRMTIVTAAHQPTDKDWEPLRIVTSIKDLHIQTNYCKNMDNSIHERGTKDADSECTDLFVPVSPYQEDIFMRILARAIALHTDRLLVQRTTGPLKIPDLSTSDYCRHFNIPPEHHTKGVDNADMVLYVAYSDDFAVVGSASVAMTCAKNTDGRPIAGSLNFGDLNDEITRHIVRLTAHVIAHALGFSLSEMNSRNMIMYKNVRGKPNAVAVVNSEKTKEMAQAHYGCSTVEGMELDDDEYHDKKLSHWERRNAKDELMAKPMGGPVSSFMGFYTNITLAVFSDLGYYKANFTMAEHMEYGRDAGCDLLNGKCMENGKTKWPNMFCNVPMTDKTPRFCTTDRMGLGYCALKNNYEEPLPEYFQYFASDKEGGIADFLTDYCPAVEPAAVNCRRPAKGWSMHGSLLNENSMCLDGNALKVKTGNETVSVSAVCAQISCAGGSVRVKYLGDKNNEWHDCPEGKSITPSSTSKSFESGTIKCPKYEEVCTVAPDGGSLVEKIKRHNPKDNSSLPFGLIPSVAFLVLSLAGYLIA